jgi:hypothetical protein
MNWFEVLSEGFGINIEDILRKPFKILSEMKESEEWCRSR